MYKRILKHTMSEASMHYILDSESENASSYRRNDNDQKLNMNSIALYMFILYGAFYIPSMHVFFSINV
jgi:hypothetical protein